jgi:hypothetical protein
MANALYNIACKKFIDGALALATADVRVLFLKDTYTFDPDHQFVADLTPGTHEISVAGYSRQALANQTTTQDNVNNRAEADADDPDFGALTAGETIAAAVYYVQVTNDADSYLIGYQDTGGYPLPTNGGNVKIQHNAEGWLNALRL